ncbi:MAG TPA: toll/interleukin-1 receptor domain-containing protein [Candidatus Limnocylindria bacterium]|nr:toll/interleukin-1 receptor domain-containing protein [Candidatus Limnocylindria bacterium]
MNRIFISYRSSDGFKDATRLAADLNRVFGKDQVFLDKQDLRGGSSWRDEIMAALGSKPIVLALITPDYFGAVEGGSRRIDRTDDPVCEELLAAFDANAKIIPLLTEGVKMPPAGSLPERVQPITSRHALRLRSEDWNNDLLRLIEDVVASGVKVQNKDWRLTFGGAPQIRAGWWIGVAVTAFLIVLGLEGVLVSEGPSGPDDYFGAAAVGLMPLAAVCYAVRTLKGSARKLRYTALAMLILTGWQVMGFVARGLHLQTEAASTTANDSAQIDLGGVWDVEMVGKGPLLPFTLAQNGVNVKMETETTQVDNHPNIAAMNKIGQTKGGLVLTLIRLKAAGTLNGRELNLLVNYVTVPDEIAFATGTLTAKVDDTNRAMHGSLLFIGDKEPLQLKLTRR